MSRKKIIYLILSIIILAALLWLMWFLFGRQNQAPDVAAPQDEVASDGVVGNLNPPVDFVNNAPQERDVAVGAPDDRADIELLARIFTEKYGTYSNQTDFAGFDDLRLFGSDSLKSWLDVYKKKILDQYSNSERYQGVTTKLLTIHIQSIDAETANSGKATVVVTANREEFKDSSADGTVKQQDLLIQFIKVNGKWLVDGAFWQ